MATPKRILVVAAHPQDPFERTGGATAKHLARGDEVMFVSLTTGVVTHAFQVFPATGADKLKDIEQVKATKRQEFERGCRKLGVTAWQCLDFNESPMLFGMAEYTALITILREFRPDCVLCPHPVEVGRHDHMDTGRFTVAAVDYARTDGYPSPLAPHTVKDIFFFYYEDFRAEQLMGTARASAGVILDITDVVERKKAAMMEFSTTQAKANEDYLQKMDKFFASIDGAVGYVHRMGYAEQYVRYNPERVKVLPLAE